MTSMLCLKRQGGLVKVHNEDKVTEVVEEGNFETQELMLNRQLADARRMKRWKESSTAPSMKTNSIVEETIKEILQDKPVKDKSIHMASLKAGEELLQPIWDGEEEVKDIHYYLAHQQMLKLRKKENLHKTWTERVYVPMRKKIIEAVDKGDWMEVKRRREELYHQYIELMNKRGNVHLDTMDPSEYYALALHDNRPAPVVRIAQTTEVNVDRIRDPLLSQDRDRNEEDRTILRLATGYRFTDMDLELIRRPRYPLVPLGRHGTDSTTWVAMPNSQMETRPRRNLIGLQLRHYADFGQWANEERNPEVIQQELNIQRKRKFAVHPPYRSQPLGFMRRYHTAPAAVDAAVNTSFDYSCPGPYPPGCATHRAEAPGVLLSSEFPPPRDGGEGMRCPDACVQETNVSNNTVFTPHHASATEPLAEVV